MAHPLFRVEVLTPEGEVFNDEVELLSTYTSLGSIGILRGHEPLLAMLDPAELRLYLSESEVVRFAQGEGFLQVGGSHAMLLVDELHDVDSLDAGDLRERLTAAQDRASAAPDGSEEQRVAEREARRYEGWLKIAEGGTR